MLQSEGLDRLAQRAAELGAELTAREDHFFSLHPARRELEREPFKRAHARLFARWRAVLNRHAKRGGSA
jgi:hypothetical protein